MDSNFNSRRSFIKKVSLAASMLGPSTVRASELLNRAARQENLKYDLMVYGATSSGVIAAYTARMYGLSVLLVEPGRHLGGLTSGGLGRTDTGGQDSYITGLSQEFYIRVGEYYGKNVPAYEFEPHVAEKIYEQYIDEAGIEVLFSRRIRSVEAQDRNIKKAFLEHLYGEDHPLIEVEASSFIDATYEGDLMARSDVSYTIGREGNEQYGELYNGVIPGRVAGHYGKAIRTREWSVDVDPYVFPRKPSSGMLPEVNGIGHEAPGTADKKVQAYCFRLCLTQNPDNKLPLYEPKGYDPARYELMARLQALEPWESLRNGFIISSMPNGKTDINNYGLVGFSSNYVGKNFDYPDANYELRAQLWDEHKKYQQGLWWFLATDDRVPSHIREETNTWGYCRDEFLDTGGWPHQLYVREARRMISDFVMTEHECVGKRKVKDGIAMGGYALDSHVVQRVVVDGHVENEGNISIHGFDPYYIPYRAMVPKEQEVVNLLVPVCLSSSHAAYGSLRMEPVFMALGQAAGVAAYLAVDKNLPVQKVDVVSIQQQLAGNPLVNRKLPREFTKILPFKI